MPIDQIKIDRSFVRDIISDPSDAAITQAIIAMARSMDLAVIAEGVETVEQLDFLRACDCHEIQGYYLSQALPAGACSDWMRAYQASGRRARVAGDALAPAAAPPASRPRLH